MRCRSWVRVIRFTLAIFPALLWGVVAWGSEPSDVVVVRPKSFEGGLVRWIDYRQSQGFRIHVVDAEANPNKIAERIRQVAKGCDGGIRGVVLAADAPSISSVSNPAQDIPTFYYPSEVIHKFGAETTLATDLPYADLDGDGMPDVAIGRIPAKSVQELSTYLARVIDYETSFDWSDWRYKIDVVAGVGGFGAVADGAIEMVTRRFLTEGIPDQYSLGMAYASPTSPYCPNPFDFQQTVLQRLNAGSLFWIYIGHGHIGTLDQFHLQDHALDILNTQTLNKVSIERGPPIAVFLACYTGAFDAPEDCLAERLVMLPKGPIAALAGSRMTMPYGLSSLGSELLHHSFAEPLQTLGDVVLQAKLKTMKSLGKDAGRQKLLSTLAAALSPEEHDLGKERIEHARLMHILGDPLLHLKHPSPVELNLPNSIRAGETLRIAGQGPKNGSSAKVEITYRRDRLPPKVIGLTEFRMEPAILRQMNETFRSANQLVIAVQEVPCSKGTFESSFSLPQELQGKVVIRSYVKSDDGVASGAKPILIRK